MRPFFLFFFLCLTQVFPFHSLQPESANIRDFVTTLDPLPVLGHTFHSYSQATNQCWRLNFKSSCCIPLSIDFCFSCGSGPTATTTVPILRTIRRLATWHVHKIFWLLDAHFNVSKEGKRIIDDFSILQHFQCLKNTIYRCNSWPSTQATLSSRFLKTRLNASWRSC